MVRNATAVWNGSGKEGNGHLTTQSTRLIKHNIHSIHVLQKALEPILKNWLPLLMQDALP